MAQWLRAIADLAEDPGLVSCTYVASHNHLETVVPGHPTTSSSLHHVEHTDTGTIFLHVCFCSTRSEIGTRHRIGHLDNL